MEQIEIWKNIKNSHYSVSNFGRVKNDKTNYILKGSKSKNGYLQVSIPIGNKKQINRYIHRLVCEYFIENPYNKRCVNHKDYNKENNNVNNLEWVTDSENQAYNHKFRKQKTSNKKVARFDINGNLVSKIYDSCKEAAKEEHSLFEKDEEVFLRGIYRCASGKRKTYLKYVWKYLDEDIVQK